MCWVMAAYLFFLILEDRLSGMGVRFHPDGCGVDRLQGHHLARPMPEERLIFFPAQTHLQKESLRNV